MKGGARLVRERVNAAGKDTKHPRTHGHTYTHTETERERERM